MVGLTRGPLQSRHGPWTFARQPVLDPGTTDGPGRDYPWAGPSVLAVPCPSPRPRQFRLDHAGKALQRLGA
jgi:hypothetical protein